MMERGDRMKKTDTRERVFAFIESYVAAHGYGPSVRELCDGLSLRSTATVHYHLRMLAEEGRIGYVSGKKRAISLTGAERGRSGSEAASGKSVPLVGTIAAGQPILAEQNVEGWLPWAGGDGWFALRVRGESMKNAGILPGDKVIVRPQQTAENGEIVVALLGDEATVKRFSRRDGHIRLLPENELYEPIDGDRARILGVVKGVVREYP